MHDNALVSWIVDPELWIVEAFVIRDLDVPLNLDGNSRNQFHSELAAARANAVANARSLSNLRLVGGMPQSGTSQFERVGSRRRTANASIQPRTPAGTPRESAVTGQCWTSVDLNQGGSEAVEWSGSSRRSELFRPPRSNRLNRRWPSAARSQSRHHHRPCEPGATIGELRVGVSAMQCVYGERRFRRTLLARCPPRSMATRVTQRASLNHDLVLANSIHLAALSAREAD